MLGQFTAIAATLALLVGSLWLLRRKGVVNWKRARPGQMLEVIESQALAPGHTLYLVRVGDRAMALTTHSSGCTLLETRPWADVRPSPSLEGRR